MRRVLHCYAEGWENQWEAFCLEFDIAVQGDSFEDVRGKMDQAIGYYLEDVAELPQEEQLAFLRRSAPFSLWAKYIFFLTLSFIFRGDAGQRRDKKERTDFTLHCPA